MITIVVDNAIRWNHVKNKNLVIKIIMSIIINKWSQCVTFLRCISRSIYSESNISSAVTGLYQGLPMTITKTIVIVQSDRQCLSDNVWQTMSDNVNLTDNVCSDRQCRVDFLSPRWTSFFKCKILGMRDEIFILKSLPFVICFHIFMAYISLYY